jgi:HSP20 family protein
MPFHLSGTDLFAIILETDMNLENLKPWNWFKHEENDAGKEKQIPVSRSEVENLPQAGPGSLMSLHRDMDRWFDDAFKSFGMPSLVSNLDSRGLPGARLSNFYRPQIDVSGDANCYQISLDVPGLTESDLSLELKDDVLFIKGEKEERSEDKDKHYYRVERSYGSFQRTLALPDDAIGDEIKANLDKGVLTLEIPRRETANQEVKRISINS